MIGRVKLVGQVSYGLLLGSSCCCTGTATIRCSPRPAVPFLKNVLHRLGLFYIPLVILVVTGTSNAVNLTDGLDGLAIGLSALAFGAFAVLSYLQRQRASSPTT